MNLQEYIAALPALSQEPSARGRESPWLHVAELRLVSRRCLVVDASYVPSADDGLVIELEPTSYVMEVRLVDYGSDRRVSAVKLLRPGVSGRIGKRLGDTSTDTAYIALCEPDILQAVWTGDESWERLDAAMRESDVLGSLAFSDQPGASVIWVEAGFGDGEYPVRELLSDAGDRVGFELGFIAAGAAYPD